MNQIMHSKGFISLPPFHFSLLFISQYPSYGVMHLTGCIWNPQAQESWLQLTKYAIINSVTAWGCHINENILKGRG